MGTPAINVKSMTTLVEQSLYQRIGGHEVIAALVDNLYQRMLHGSHTWYYWKGRGADSLAAECRQYIDLVCIAAGGPVKSEGLDTEAPNTGLGIGKVEWEYFVDLAAEALEQSSLSDGEQEELFFLLARSKAAIATVRRSPSSVGVFAAYPRELTPRETEVLRLVALGQNNSEIAGELFISVNTVTRHLTNIFAKTSAKNRVQAAVYAAQRRIV